MGTAPSAPETGASPPLERGRKANLQLSPVATGEMGSAEKAGAKGGRWILG
jgi:hypothetical protein